MPFPGIYPPPLPCEATATSLAVELRAAQDAYGAAPPDLARFYAAVGSANQKLSCLVDSLPVSAVADLYEVQAILAYIQKDTDSSTAFLRGALALGGGLPAGILASTPKLAELERAAATVTAQSPAPIAATEGTTLWVDGSAAAGRPTDRPYLLQVLWEDGKVHWTGLLPTGAAPETGRLGPPPKPPPIVEAPVEAPTCPDCPVVTARPRPALTLAALGATAASAGLYGLAATSKLSFFDPETPESELEGLQKRANAAQWSAIGLGAVALGLDVTVLIAALRGEER